MLPGFTSLKTSKSGRRHDSVCEHLIRTGVSNHAHAWREACQALVSVNKKQKKQTRHLCGLRISMLRKLTPISAAVGIWSLFIRLQILSRDSSSSCMTMKSPSESLLPCTYALTRYRYIKLGLYPCVDVQLTYLCSRHIPGTPTKWPYFISAFPLLSWTRLASFEGLDTLSEEPDGSFSSCAILSRILHVLRYRSLNIPY